MAKTIINFLVLLFVLQFVIQNVSASCLTDTEINSIKSIVNDSTNQTILMNLFDRLCNSQATNDAISSFNTTINSRIDQLNNNTDNKISQLQNTLNNSALANAIIGINQLYNQSISFDKQVRDLEYKINDRIDNQSLSIIQQNDKFKQEINQLLEDKKSVNLSTNRIILIVAIIIVAGLAVWYYKGKRNVQIPNIQRSPIDQRDEARDIRAELDSIKYQVNNENNNPSKIKRK